MKYLINYANDAYVQAQHLNSWAGKNLARFDRVIEYSDKDIAPEFYEKHKKILLEKRGNGLWLWKSYFILKTLEQVNDGDIVFYCDSGAFFIRKPKKIFEIIEKEDIWVSEIPLIEEQFTASNLFESMNCTDEHFKTSNQVQSGFIGLKKNERTISIVKEWLEYSKNYNNSKGLDDGTNKKFIAHREDQSILSLLIKKHAITPHQDPTQYGKLPEKYDCNDKYIMKYTNRYDYKPCILLHRTKNNDKWNIFKQFMCIMLPRKIALKFVLRNNSKNI